MTAPTFTVQGYEVMAEQAQAGLDAMRGVFRRHDVAFAIAKVRHANRLHNGVVTFDGQEQIAILDRITDRLLQSERRAGRIRVAKGRGRGMWEVVDG